MKRVVFLALSTITVILIAENITYAQPGMPIQIKSPIHRIVTVFGSNNAEATGVLFIEQGHRFLITNRHVLFDEMDQPADSMFIFLNDTTESGDVISGPEKATIYLRAGTEKYYFEPSIINMDLILISVATDNSHGLAGKTAYSMRTSLILECEKLKSIAEPGNIVTAIGFPEKGPIRPTRTPEYLWGDLIKFDCDIILSNLPTTHGTSGSPVVIRHKGNYYLLGINFGRRNGALAIPCCKIFDCFKRYFTEINQEVERKKESNK